MLTSSTPSSGKKTEEKTENKDENQLEFKDLETEINDVINNCKSIIKNNYSVIKKKQNVDKKKDKDLSKITLETVAQDMSNILENLKTHLGPCKGQDSFSDVVPKLEELIKNKQLANNNRPNSKPNPPGLVAKPLSGKMPAKANNPVNKPKQNNAKPAQANAVNKPPSAQVVRPPSAQVVRPPSAQVVHPPSAQVVRPPSAQVVRPANAQPVRPASAQMARQSNQSKLSDNSKRRNVSNTSTNRKWVRPPVPSTISRDVYDPLGNIRDEVERAKQLQKTFTIRGCFQAVRRALISRGWVEKFHLSYRDRVNEELKKFQHFSIPELIEMLRNKEVADVCRRLIKSKLLSTHQVDFYWSYDYDGFKECSDKIKLTMINKLRRDGYSYTSKKGLCDASKKSWFNIPGLASMSHPRTYNLVKNGDTGEFIKDFSLTAAMSLLKWIMKNSVTHECKVISPSGKIPLSVFNFALNECYKFIKTSRHEVTTDFPEVFEQEWNEFLENYYKIIQFGNHFKQVNGITESDMVRKSNYILTHLKDHWKYLDMDGIMNIWILKPINGSMGVGIHICRTLKYILGVIKSNPNRRYIVQKYIERPLLIYNTKFDIRQWFLISSSVPLMIWIYKFSYLRFSSQTYSLRKLHESIHLTNNSVQCRYGKYQKDIALPPYNMWDSTQFKNYLSDIGYPNVFNDIIYPGMKQCLTAAVLLHKDKLDRRRNCFELQGADFILTEDFKPWLLEINSSPALHASTPVTARMCPQVLEDVIKVVVDHHRNYQANTGGFELIFDERVHGATLKEHSKAVVPVKPNYAYTHPLHDLSSFIENAPKTSMDSDAAEYIKQIGVGLRKTLENLLQILKNEKQKRQLQRNKSIETNSSNNIITGPRNLPLTRKENPANPVTIQAETVCDSSISSKVVMMSSEVNNVKNCPELPENKSISIKNNNLPNTPEGIATCSHNNTSPLTTNDKTIIDESISCRASVRERYTDAEECTLFKYSARIAEVMESFHQLCESDPHSNLKIFQKQDVIRLDKSQSVIADLDVLFVEMTQQMSKTFCDLGLETTIRTIDVTDDTINNQTGSDINAEQSDKIECAQELAIQDPALISNIQNNEIEIIEIMDDIIIDYKNFKSSETDDDGNSSKGYESEYEKLMENVGKHDAKISEIIGNFIVEKVNADGASSDVTEESEKLGNDSTDDKNVKSLKTDDDGSSSKDYESEREKLIENLAKITEIRTSEIQPEKVNIDEAFFNVTEAIEKFVNDAMDYKNVKSLKTDDDGSDSKDYESDNEKSIENVAEITEIVGNSEIQPEKLNIDEASSNVAEAIDKLINDATDYESVKSLKTDDDGISRKDYESEHEKLIEKVAEIIKIVGNEPEKVDLAQASSIIKAIEKLINDAADYKNDKSLKTDDDGSSSKYESEDEKSIVNVAEITKIVEKSEVQPEKMNIEASSNVMETVKLDNDITDYNNVKSSKADGDGSSSNNYESGHEKSIENVGRYAEISETGNPEVQLEKVNVDVESSNDEYEKTIENVGKNAEKLNVDEESSKTDDEANSGKDYIGEFEELIDKLCNDATGLEPIAVEMNDNANMNKQNIEVKWINRNNTDTEGETSNTSSAIESYYVSDNPPLATMAKIVSDTNNTRDKPTTTKHRSISFVTTNKRRSIKQMVKQSLNHLLGRKKNKPSPPPPH